MTRSKLSGVPDSVSVGTEPALPVEQCFSNAGQNLASLANASRSNSVIFELQYLS